MARTLWSGFLWQLAGGWGTRVGTLLVFTVLARLLAPEQLGAVSYVQGLILLLLVLADLALAEYLVYRQDASDAVADAIWWLQTLFGLLTAGLLILLAFVRPHWLLPAGVDPMLLAAAAACLPLLAAGKVPEALLRRTPAGFRVLALRQLWTMLAGAAVALPLAAAGAGAWSLIAKQAVEAMLGLLLFFPPGSWRPRRHWQPAQALAVMRASWGLMGSRLVDMLAQRVDTLLIGQWLGVQALGWYALAQKLYQVLQGTLSGALYGVANSRLGALREDRDAGRVFLLQALTAAALVMAPLLLLAALFAGPAVQLLFGARWLDSIPLLQLMLLGAVLQALLQTGLAPYASLVQQDNRWVLGLVLADLALTLGLIALGLPFGLPGVVLALALKPLLMGLPWWVRAARLYGIGGAAWRAAAWPALLPCAGLALGWGLARGLLPQAPWAALGASLLGLLLGCALLVGLAGPRLRALRQAFHR